MQIIIIVCFNVCWMPLQLNAMIFAISPEYYSNLMLDLILIFITFLGSIHHIFPILLLFSIFFPRI